MDTEKLQKAADISTNLLKLIRLIQEENEKEKSKPLVEARAKINEFVHFNTSEEQKFKVTYGPFSPDEIKLGGELDG